MTRVGFTGLAEFLRGELHDRVIPFWLRHGVDHEYGGLLTCLGEDGAVVSTDKYMWSQARALWVFSELARRTGDARYRAVADGLYGFCERFGRNGRGEWVFRLSREGGVLEDSESIYTDGFAILGASAYFSLTGSGRAERLVRETCASVRGRLAIPGSYKIKPYELPPGTRVHGISMLFALAFWEAGQALHDGEWTAEGHAHAREILRHFAAADGSIREFLDMENRPAAGTLGTCCLPGHALESMWALIRIFRAAGETAEVARCAGIIRRHLEIGWDERFGGIFLAIDRAGQPPYWPFADYKPWWPAVEAMYALLLAYSECRAPWCLEWYERVHNYAFTHYPVRPRGEWRNRLDRRGRPVDEIIALPVKDPFHLPRALMLAGEVLERIGEWPEELRLVLE